MIWLAESKVPAAAGTQINDGMPVALLVGCCVTNTTSLSDFIDHYQALPNLFSLSFLQLHVQSIAIDPLRFNTKLGPFEMKI